jgi:hypothetical protein
MTTALEAIPQQELKKMFPTVYTRAVIAQSV